MSSECLMYVQCTSCVLGRPWWTYLLQVKLEFTCSKSTLEVPEQYVESVNNKDTRRTSTYLSLRLLFFTQYTILIAEPWTSSWTVERRLNLCLTRKNLQMNCSEVIEPFQTNVPFPYHHKTSQNQVGHIHLKMVDIIWPKFCFITISVC